MSDVLHIGIAVLGSVPLLSCRTRRWHLLWVALPLFAAAVVWGQLLPAGPIAQLSPAIVVMFILPGFLVLELAFPTLAQRLDPLERGPLLFGLSMGIWTLIAAVAYRAQMPSDLVIGGVLVGDAIGLLAVLGIRLRYRDSKPSHEKNGRFDYVKSLYFLCLIVVLLIVAGVVGFSAQIQGHEFDSCTHLAGYHKISDNVKIIGGNPFLGPQYSYYTHYTANPWYLVFGLSARLAHTNVTWLYIYLAAILSPLFFLTFYSLLKVLTKDYWIAIIGTLLVIGPWISEAALNCAPLGNFYLQFLPFPGILIQLILCPLWFVYCFRYVRFQTSENWIVVALLAIAVMGVHPELGIPYSICIVFIVSMFFLTTRREKIKNFALVAVIVISGAIIAYLIVNPVGKEYLKGGWIAFDPEDVLRQLLERSWIISPDLYAIHPKSLITLESLKNIIGCIVISLFIGFQPKLFFEEKAEGWLPAFFISISSEITQRLHHLSCLPLGQFSIATFRTVTQKLPAFFISISRKVTQRLHRLSCLPLGQFSISTSQNITQSHLAVAVAVVFAGQYLILYNPIIVPIIVKLFGSAIPIRLFARSYEVLGLVCNFGAIASILVLVLRSNNLYKYRKRLKLILLIIILIVGIGVMLGRPKVYALIKDIFNRPDYTISILDLKNKPPYKELSKLDQGVVAISMEHSEYLVMTTHHYVVSSTRMTKKRQLDNEKILKFSVTSDAMKDLLVEYKCRYVVVSLDDNMVSNGGFSLGTSDWSTGYGLTIASVPGGKSGNCLQVKGEEYGSQIVWQNITCDVGKHYEIKGSVKSGTSGNEPFKIQIFQKTASGQGEFSMDGATSGSWVEYSMIFKANYRDLCVMLRKNSATHGTMLFDAITCHEVIPRYIGSVGVKKDGKRKTPTKEFIPYTSLQRFREHPELFDEILTLEEFAIFEVKK